MPGSWPILTKTPRFGPLRCILDARRPSESQSRRTLCGGCTCHSHMHSSLERSHARFGGADLPGWSEEKWTAGERRI